MSVYDTATKLASEIRNSKEYNDFVTNMKNIKRDKDNEYLLSEYKKLQYNLQYATMNNKKIDKKALKKMESIQNKIRDNEKIYNYLLSEEKFNLMMDNINKIIAQTVKEDYKSKRGINMKILVMKVDLRAAYVHSLKEKRMIVKSIIGKLQNKFNVSIREVENQDLHQRISIGIVKLELNSKDSDQSKDKILNFIEENCEAEIIDIESEIINY